MSKTDKNKKFVTLEGVRASYKAKDDTIHLTSTDPDVQASGFHLSLNKGTQTEKTLRNLLTKNGVIQAQDEFGAITSTEQNFNVNQHKGTIIAVNSPKNGTGTTTFVTNLAQTIIDKSEHTKKVIIVELPGLIGEYVWFTGQHSPTTLNYYLEQEKTFVNLQKSIIKHGEHLDILMAPQKVSSIPVEELYTNIFTHLKKEYDYIILDVPANSGQEPLIVANADAITFISDLAVLSLSRLAYLIQNITEEYKNQDKEYKNKIGIVLNKTYPNSGLDIKIIKRFIGPHDFPILAAIPMNEDIFQETNKPLKERKIIPSYVNPIKRIAQLLLMK
jgi:cellulose biosynthesis protein BcsQ